MALQEPTGRVRPHSQEGHVCKYYALHLMRSNRGQTISSTVVFFSLLRNKENIQMEMNLPCFLPLPKIETRPLLWEPLV